MAGGGLPLETNRHPEPAAVPAGETGMRLVPMVTALFGTLLATGPAVAGEQWLSRVVEAHFGELAAGDLETLSFFEDVVVHAVGQSRRPGPPWDASGGVRHYAVDFLRERFAAEIRVREAGGFDFHHRLVLDGDSGFVASFIDGYRRALDAQAGWPSSTADVFRRTPAWIVRELAVAAPEDLAPPDAGRRLFFTSSAGPLELEFGPDWRLSRSRWDGGEAPVEARFENYRRVNGLAMAARVTLYWRGQLVNDIRVRDVAVNESIERYLEAPRELPLLEMPDAAGARDFAVREIAEGVWFIGEQVHYQLFVEQDDHVVALGSVAGVTKRLAALRKRIGHKPLRYAVITHHHDDHLEGIAELAEAGAVLLVAPTHAEVVRQAAGEAQEPELMPVHGSTLIGSGDRVVRVIDIGPNVHAEHMLAAYLPEQQILWSADLFVQPPERPVRAGIEPIRALAEAIDTHDLDVERLLDPHSPRINSIAELRESVRKTPGGK